MLKNKSLLIPLLGCALVLAGCGGNGNSTGSSASSVASSTPTSSSSSSSSSSSTPAAPTAANGIFNYNGKLTSDQTAEAIATLEGWGMDNHLTGLPVCDSGGLVIKGSRVTFPTSNTLLTSALALAVEPSMLRNRWIRLKSRLPLGRATSMSGAAMAARR
jgi:hypothetical protein